MNLISEMLGRTAFEVLRSPRLLGFAATREVDDESDPPEIRYDLEAAGLEFLCDVDGEVVSTVFVHSDGPLARLLLEGLTLGEVASSCELDAEGQGIDDPVLGPVGPWKRYRLGDALVHFQLDLDGKDVEMTTVMRADVAP